MATYKHSPIDLDRPSIRLVRLLKAEDPGTVPGEYAMRCEIVFSFLDEGIPYEALSYAWGDPGVTKDIYVEDLRYPVTVNLESALQHLQPSSSESDRFLWIDAICINQTDDRERGHQVQQMGRIYKQAERVVVWLSPGTVDSDSAMEFMQSTSLPWPEHPPDSVYALLDRSWFKRAWVIQEVANARTLLIVCGRKSLTASQISRIQHIPIYHSCGSFVNAALVDLLSHTARERHAWVKTNPVLLLAHMFRGCVASDVRDKVYALLGISSDTLTADIVVDYAKPVAEIWTELALSTIKQTGTLDVLTYCGIIRNADGTSSLKLPSWVPDLRFPLLSACEEPTKFTNLTWRSSCSPTFVDGVLRGVRGLCFGHVLDDHSIPAAYILYQWSSFIWTPQQQSSLAKDLTKLNELFFKHAGYCDAVSGNPVYWERYEVKWNDYANGARSSDLLCWLIGAPAPAILREHRFGEHNEPASYEFIRFVHLPRVEVPQSSDLRMTADGSLSKLPLQEFWMI